MSKAKSNPRGKKEAKKEVKETPDEVARPVVVKPLGRAPFARVTSRHGGAMVTRRGKGFSFGELETAALPIRFVGSWRVPLDSRRRSVIGENVAVLKKWYIAPTKGVKQSHGEPLTAVAIPKPKRSPKKRAAIKKKKTKK